MGGIAKVDCCLPSSGGSVGSGVSAMGIIGKVMAAVLGLACLGRAHALEQYESKLTASLPALRTGLPALDGPHSVDGRWTSESVPHAAAYVRHQTGANPQTGQPAWTAWFGNADLHRHEGPPLSMGEAMGHMPILNGNAGADGIAHLDSLTAPSPPRLRQPGAALTVFHGHLCLKRAPRRPCHLYGSQPQVLYLTGRERRDHHALFWPPLSSCFPLRFLSCLRNHRGPHYTTVLLFPEIALATSQRELSCMPRQRQQRQTTTSQQ